MSEKTIPVFVKSHDYLVCIDSDGTAMDTMNIKHIRCFGPCFVEEFGLEDYKEEALKRWNQINLYEKTRGKFRFVTLLQILEEYQAKGIFKDNLSDLKKWVGTSPELSNNSLKAVLKTQDSEILKKTLHWSEASNEAIGKLTFDDKKPFKGVKEVLEYLRGKADVAVVSGAGAKALDDEWGHYGIAELADVMTSQNDGTKQEIIHKLLPKGYKKENVLMIGDAFPDVTAAQANGVYFYPIMVKGEEKSWKDLLHVYLPEFLSGNYSKFQEKLMQEFLDSFE
jgi:phosphoglycolate phosphatase-like HAD superfamily hydrolase